MCQIVTEKLRQAEPPEHQQPVMNNIEYTSFPISPPSSPKSANDENMILSAPVIDFKQKWEQGNPDFMGFHSFDNILNKLHETMQETIIHQGSQNHVDHYQQPIEMQVQTQPPYEMQEQCNSTEMTMQEQCNSIEMPMQEPCNSNETPMQQTSNKSTNPQSFDFILDKIAPFKTQQPPRPPVSLEQVNDKLQKSTVQSKPNKSRRRV